MFPECRVDSKWLDSHRFRDWNVRSTQNHISLVLKLKRDGSKNKVFDLPDKPLRIGKLYDGVAIYQLNGSPEIHDLVAYVQKLPNGNREILTAADVQKKMRRSDWDEACNYFGE